VLKKLFGLMLLCVFFGPKPAMAEGIAWSWDKPVTYQIMAQVQLPELLQFNASENIDARMVMFRLDLVTTCTPVKDKGKKKVELVCTMDDVRLLGQAIPQDKGQLALSLKDYDKQLTGATLEVLMTRDGLVKRYDLNGIERSNRREVQFEENLMIVVARALAGIDLQLPKGGVDKGKIWKQKRVLAMGFPSNQGTIGSSVLRSVITATEPNSVVITSEGEGLMGSGVMIEAGGRTQPKNLYKMKMDGVARFDTTTGTLLEREYFVEGVSTTSSAKIDSITGMPYVQKVTVTRLDVMPEKLGESGELER
jgi:hypothetical protein